MQLSSLQANNGVLVQTEPSDELACLADQIIGRLSAVSGLGCGGGVCGRRRVVCALCMRVASHELCD